VALVTASTITHSVEMLRYAIYLPGRVVDRLLRPIGRNFRLLSGGACSIGSSFSLFGPELSLLSLKCSLPSLLCGSAAAIESNCRDNRKRNPDEKRPQNYRGASALGTPINLLAGR
jgi:hypothetical protein